MKSSIVHLLCVRRSDPRVHAAGRLGVSGALQAPLALAGAQTLTGCQAVESIFKAGVWVGVLAVIVVLALIVFAVGKLLT